MAVVGGQIGQTKESRLKVRKQILDWFNKAIKKGIPTIIDTNCFSRKIYKVNYGIYSRQL